MKVRLLACVLMLAVFGALCGAAFAGEAAKPVAKSKVLFMTGGPFHDQPVLYPMLQQMLGTDYVVTVTKDLDQFKPENIRNFDLVVNYTTNQTLTKEQEKGLIDFVADGKGFVGIHCATDTFKNSDSYWKMVGGKFTKHGHETFKVNITGKRHPVVKGMSSFEINDESYCDDFHPGSKCIVLARREKDSEPSAWVQYYGKGRVFVTGLGHDKEAWDNPGFQELVVRGSDWATYRLNP